MSIYTANRYQSFDLDFIVNLPTRRARITQLLAEIRFAEENRYFKHPDAEFFLEFPPGPLAVGDEPVKEIVQMGFATGELQLISPTDCVKDRLAGYFHWGDLQCLDQACLVAASCDIDLKELARWVRHEGKEPEFAIVRDRLSGG